MVVVVVDANCKDPAGYMVVYGTLGLGGGGGGEESDTLNLVTGAGGNGGSGVCSC